VWGSGGKDPTFPPGCEVGPRLEREKLRLSCHISTDEYRSVQDSLVVAPSLSRGRYPLLSAASVWPLCTDSVRSKWS